MELKELLAQITTLPVADRLHLLAQVSEDIATELEAGGEAKRAESRVGSFADLYGIARGAEVSEQDIDAAQRAVSEVELERFNDI
jgi:hypothetical protein